MCASELVRLFLPCNLLSHVPHLPLTDLWLLQGFKLQFPFKAKAFITFKICPRIYYRLMGREVSLIYDMLCHKTHIMSINDSNKQNKIICSDQKKIYIANSLH